MRVRIHFSNPSRRPKDEFILTLDFAIRLLNFIIPEVDHQQQVESVVGHPEYEWPADEVVQKSI